MNKKTLAAILIIATLAGVLVAWAVSPYIWWSTEIPVTDDLTATVDWSGNPVVGETITISISITNPTGATVDGTLLVEMYETDKTTLDLELFSGAISVPVTGYTADYYWTANLGSHYAKATFTTT